MSSSVQSLPLIEDTENWVIQKLFPEHQDSVQQKPYTVHERQPFYCSISLAVFILYCFLNHYNGTHIFIGTVEICKSLFSYLEADKSF